MKINNWVKGAAALGVLGLAAACGTQAAATTPAASAPAAATQAPAATTSPAPAPSSPSMYRDPHSLLPSSTCLSLVRLHPRQTT